MELLTILAAIDSPAVILLLLVIFFGVIAGITLILRLLIPGLKDKGGQIDEEIAVQEELERVLEPITDEEVLKAMEQETTKKDEE